MLDFVWFVMALAGMAIAHHLGTHSVETQTWFTNLVRMISMDTQMCTTTPEQHDPPRYRDTSPNGRMFKRIYVEDVDDTLHITSCNISCLCSIRTDIALATLQ